METSMNESPLMSVASKGKSFRRSAGRYAAAALAVAVCAGLGATSAMAASGSWDSVNSTTTDWDTGTNWISGNKPGATTWTAPPTNADVATFGGAGANKSVVVDLNRSVGQLSFTSSGYTIGGGVGNNTLYMGNVGGTKFTISGSGNSADISAPIELSTSGWGTWSTFYSATGATLNFNGAINSTQSGNSYLNTNLGGTVNFNAPITGKIGFRFNSGPITGTVYLKAANTFTAGIGMEQTSSKVVLAAADALQSGSLGISRGGYGEITATNGLSGSASLSVTGNLYGSLPNPGQFVGEVTINTSNDYTGSTSVGNIYNPVTGAQLSTLLIKNTTGSATGTGNVSVSGLLAGSGRIDNSGTTNGVTLNKSTFTFASNTYTAYGQLSPGNVPGGIGSMTMNLGSKGLNISASVADGNTQSLLFDLIDPSNNDKVVLLNSTVLDIGSGGLNFDDFKFNLPNSTLATGTYTLFDTAQAISGSLGSSLSGMLDGKLATLSLADGGKDIVLTVVPEPATLGLLAIGGLGLLARRRRIA